MGEGEQHEGGGRERRSRRAAPLREPKRAEIAPALRPRIVIPIVDGSRYRPETTTEAPKPKPVLVGSWANWGKTMNEAYMPAPSRKAATFVVQTPAHAHHRHVDQRVVAAHLDRDPGDEKATPTASRPIVLAEPQPQVVVSLIASSTTDMPIVISAAASQLMRPGRAHRRLGDEAPGGDRGGDDATSGSQKSQW